MGDQNLQEDPIVEPKDEGGAQVETVNKSDHERALADMHKFKSESRAKDEQLDAMKKEMATAEEAKLVEAQNYKTLYENAKLRADTAEDKNKDLSDAFFSDKKTSAIKEAARKHGILDSAVDDLELLDTASVIVERTDQGRVNILGAEDFIQDIKSKKQHWFGTGHPPKVNAGNPGSNITAAVLSPAEIIKLQDKDPAAYKKAMEAYRNKRN